MEGGVERVLEETLARHGGRVVYKHVEESGEPEPGPLVEELGVSEKLVEALRSRGIRRLYRFQAEAAASIAAGNDTVIVAGTGTGKTEAFLVPVLDKALRLGRRPTAILVYPTKALARDQLSRIRGYLEALGLEAEVYDGDSPESVRRRVLTSPPHVLVTNPDMLHYSLAMARGLREVVREASYVVLDELHLYGGVFGSHVKWVVYRLLRYARDAVMVGSGATIGNPGEHGERLFGRKPVVVEGPRRRRGTAVHYMADCGRASRRVVASTLAAALAKMGLKTLVFIDSQQRAEWLARDIAKKGVKSFVHRAGLPPEYRAMVEEAMREGRVDVVVATPTLELGIDVGTLDVAIMVGLPSSYASYIQRAGRVGRRERPGYVITLLGASPLESYFSRRPGEYFAQSVPPVFMEPGNVEVAKTHVAAMLAEYGSLRDSEIPDFARGAVEDLARAGVVRLSGGRIVGSREGILRLLRSSGLRSSGPVVSIVDERGKTIGYRELPQALYELHPGAIYYHMGRPYMSVSLDLAKLEARVRRVPDTISVYTRALHTTYAVPVSEESARLLGSVVVSYGSVKAEVYVEGYVVIDEASGQTLSEVMLETPLKWRFTTKGLYASFPSLGMHPLDASSSFHAIEHVLIAAGKPVAGYSDTDVGGVSYPSGLIVIYDSSPGGNGASRTLFERLDKAAALAARILAECACEDGCPRCVYSPYCGNNNKMLSRRGALRILEAVMRGETARVEAAPEGKPVA
ncbi:MAG: DEAD/DEAH box helicase [Acidilobaceae archaeon]